MLLDSITPGVEAGAHRATVVIGRALRVFRASRIETGLRHRPLVALEPIVGGLLLALSVAGKDVDIRPPPPGPRLMRAHGVLGVGAPPPLGAGDGRRMGGKITVIAGVPQVVPAVVVIVGSC